MLPSEKWHSERSASGGSTPLTGACPGRWSETVQKSAGPPQAMRPFVAPQTVAISCQPLPS